MFKQEIRLNSYTLCGFFVEELGANSETKQKPFCLLGHQRLGRHIQSRKLTRIVLATIFKRHPAVTEGGGCGGF